MPFAESDGAEIFWHEIGRGSPIILIMGLGCCSSMWFRLAPRLAKHHRVIMLDNRGTGRTRVLGVSLTYRIRTMAKDVLAVMNAANIDSAQIVGFSMGGMITQQIAIDNPARVDSLVLLGTHCGGFAATVCRPDVAKLLFNKDSMTPEEALMAMKDHTYAATTPEQVIAEDFAVRIANYPLFEDYKAQLWGLMGWTSYFSLPSINAPTLVMHGLQDELIPSENGRLISRRIPGAQLVEIEEASHWLHTDQTDLVADTILQFFATSK